MDELNAPEPEQDPSESPRGRMAESLRKALVTGLSAVFVTEEGIRNALGDMRLPKDALSYLVQQTNNSRREVFRILSEELKGFLKNADVAGALKKALAGMKLEVKAEIRFVEEGVKVAAETRQTGPEPSEPAHHHPRTRKKKT